MKEIIKIEKVFKKQILKEISTIIHAGECIAIMGNSGAGKSTLLNIISGLEQPSGGSVYIDRINILDLKEPKLTKFRSKNISYIFQDYKLVEYLSVEENIKLIENNNKNKIDNAKFKYIVEELGLLDKLKKNVSILSGGQKQRVAIARAMIGNSKIIFADEPTGALDVLNKKIVLKELIKNSKANNKTLVIVTHDPEVALATERIIFIKAGAIKEEISSKKVTIKQIEEKLLNSYE